MTLAQLQALDFAALWASLSLDRQAEIGALVIKAEFATQVEVDGGFDTSREDRLRAELTKTQATEDLPQIIWAAFPDLLPVSYDDAYPMWQLLEGREAPAEVEVAGVGRRPLIHQDQQWFVPIRDQLVELGGAVNRNARDDDALADWVFWTVADIEAERRRRHPELADGASIAGWTASQG